MAWARVRGQLHDERVEMKQLDARSCRSDSSLQPTKQLTSHGFGPNRGMAVPAELVAPNYDL